MDKIWVVITVDHRKGAVMPPMVFQDEDTCDYFVEQTNEMFPGNALSIRVYETRIQTISDMEKQKEMFEAVTKHMPLGGNNTQA